MRENTQSIIASSNYSTFAAPSGQKYARLQFPSPRAAHEFALKHAQTENEARWNRNSDSEWLGLETQSLRAFDQSGIATHPLALVRSTEAKMPHRQSRLARTTSAVSGAVWNVPSVLANIPLAAITRSRTKLTPLPLNLSCCFSADVTAESLAPRIAKLTRAIHNYTLAGGVVNLSVFNTCRLSRVTNGCFAMIIETRINASDLANLSLALSPAYLRAVTGKICTAFSDAISDSLYPTSTPLPNMIEVSGTGKAIHAALNGAIAKLQII